MQAKTSSEAKPKPRRQTGKHAGEALARAAVAARSNGVCEVQIPGVCLGRATNWHHRLPRSHGGKWLAGTGLAVCGSGSTGCHGALTNTNGRRDEFVRNGWIVESWQNPLEVPVRLAAHGWSVLDNEGGLTPSLPLDVAS